jgi:hypothetical protein
MTEFVFVGIVLIALLLGGCVTRDCEYEATRKWKCITPPEKSLGHRLEVLPFVALDCPVKCR